jgi:hypothetical protein
MQHGARKMVIAYLACCISGLLGLPCLPPPRQGESQQQEKQEEEHDTYDLCTATTTTSGITSG